MSVLDGLTETILILAGGFLGGCIASVTFIFLNIRKKNNNNKLDTVV